MLLVNSIGRIPQPMHEKLKILYSTQVCCLVQAYFIDSINYGSQCLNVHTLTFISLHKLN